jgi:type II secretory pathway pseudopilin PulG
MPRNARAFSLIEVAIAVVIVGVTVVTVIGLLAALARRSGEARDRQVAVGMADAIALELRRQVAETGWGPTIAASAPEETSPAIRLVARRDGTRLRAWDPAERPPADHYYLIEVRRFAAGPLVAPPGAMVVPVRIIVSWPLRTLTAEGPALEIPEERRTRIEFAHALNR